MKQEKSVLNIFAILLAMVALSAFSMAGGLANVTTAITGINTDVVAIAAVLVVLALMWAGFQIMFRNAGIADVAAVVVGALIVGAAATLGPLLVAG